MAPSKLAKVRFATLHHTVHVPSMGQIGPTLDEGQASLKKVEMTLVDVNGTTLLEITCNKVVVLTPLTSVSHLVLAAE